RVRASAARQRHGVPARPGRQTSEVCSGGSGVARRDKFGDRRPPAPRRRSEKLSRVDQAVCDLDASGKLGRTAVHRRVAGENEAEHACTEAAVDKGSGADDSPCSAEPLGRYSGNPEECRPMIIRTWFFAALVVGFFSIDSVFAQPAEQLYDMKHPMYTFVDVVQPNIVFGWSIDANTGNLPRGFMLWRFPDADGSGGASPFGVVPALRPGAAPRA